jgi:hypothetical protein
MTRGYHPVIRGIVPLEKVEKRKPLEARGDQQNYSLVTLDVQIVTIRKRVEALLE